MELLLDELHKIQDTCGYIPENLIDKLAKTRDIPKSELYGIASFYSRFYFKKVPKYVIRVCKSISCGINNSAGILQSIQNELGIKVDEETKDKLFRLESVECLGYCGEGPVVSINDKIYPQMTSTSIINILRELKGSDNNA